MSKDTFRNFMISTYSIQELEDISKYGCQNGVSGLIYYDETTDFYNRYSEELHEIVFQYKQETGDIPQCLIEDIDNAKLFKNAMVWFCAEYIAYELVSQAVDHA